MNNPNFTHQLMKAIQQTDEWDRIWREHPEIQAARSRLETVMQLVESKEFYDTILDAVFDLTTVCENTAVRYGARVTLALLDAVAHP